MFLRSNKIKDRNKVRSKQRKGIETMKKYTTLVLLIMFVCCFFGTTPVKAEMDLIAMHRLYNPNSGEHFYTGDVSEKNHLSSVGWKYEGIGWNAPKQSSIPVYRLYNPNAGDHHYTLDASEKDHLVKVGWKYEGIGWYSDESQGVPLYRQYNPNAKTGTHNYTTSKEENDFLVSIGWKAEGIGWYGVMEIPYIPHTHDWSAEYETIHHPEQGHNEQYVVKEAWTENVPIYENQIRSICNTCGADITGFAAEHAKQHALKGENGAHHTEVIQVQTGTETIEHSTEYGTRYVVDQAAYDEQVPAGFKCSCGATK